MTENNPQSDPDLTTREIGIDGMTCDHCVRRVEKAIRGVAGVAKASVYRQVGKATVTFDSRKTNEPAICEAILKSGYKPAVT